MYASTSGEEYSFVKKWGIEGDADNQFEEPTGIGIDASNNVYVSVQTLRTVVTWFIIE